MPSELGTSRDELAGLKERLAHRSPILSSPRDFLRQHAETVDGLVRRAFLKAHGEGPLPSACLVAVGGYGRLELAPGSDVDLLLLYAPARQEGLPGLIEKTLYPLWDLGLEVSCSSRSVEECLRLAQSDPSVRTGLMDSRYLDGDYDLFRRLHDLFGRKVLHRGVRDFARALMTEILQRHQRFEDPAYVLEPEIKEGRGGLRDFQIGRWIIRSRYKTDRWESILFPDESRALERSLQFLWAVRNELHLLSGRRQDTLTFELQEKVAPLLRFSPGTRGIEELMREYHLASQKILAFAMGFLDRVLSEPPPFRKLLLAFRRRTIDASFCLAEGELCLVDPVALRKDLSQLMRLFEHSQSYKAPMSFRVEESAREVIPFIDDRFRGSPEVSRIFLAILAKGEWADRILRKMHDLGFLSRYFPEFAEIEGRVHYDLYHVHPVDIHSLLTVEELVRLKTGDYEKEYPALTSMVREIGRPDLLLLAALLHDIGKAREGHHSLTGEEMIREIGRRMGLDGAESEVLGFLVRNHLVMLETAFRRDLQDEGTIARFGRLAGDLESLKMLYLLTFADIKAVGPEAWTSWKNALLAELFLKTSRFFERGRRRTPFEEEDENLRKVQSLLGATASPEEIESLPARYLSAFPEAEILHHLELARSLENRPLAVEWTLLEKGRARVTVCTRDRYGLFARIAGAMFLNRLSILEAQIHTWATGVVLDTFWIAEGPDEMEKRLERFRRDCEAILDGTTTLKDLLAQRQEASPIPRKVIPGVPVDVKINHRDSDFFTIVEITGEDRLGILYDITQALTDHGCDIHIAKISTLGNRIVDAFYVQNEWGDKIGEDESTDRLRKILLDRLTSA